MAFVFHIHTALSCETTHSTTCASIDGAEWEHSCIEIISGRNIGKFGASIETQRVSVRKKTFSFLR